ncbi:MAG TPA: hypothetical protein VJ824_04205 [Bacillota bacterium]|nr:hypothetical protein [Bacillota bacterium]
MNIADHLEKFRYILFMGRYPDQDIPMSQEEYVEAYEEQLERDPALERKLILEFSSPLLPIYRKHIEQLAKMEQTISGNDEPISFTDEEVLDELYDEISNIETEEEWQNFKKIFVH